MMFASPTQWLHSSIRFVALLIVTVVCGFPGSSVAFGQAQSNASDLQGVVRDQSGALVGGATVTARNPATNTSKEATTNQDGTYLIVNLTPGDYEVTIEAPNFKKAVLPGVKLTVGQRADLDVALEVGQVSEVVTISGATAELVETSKTAVATTVDLQRIENLPINERNYLSFALTTSTVGRDNGRPIGPAPTTGLNFGGQRGRSNLVQVDGADNTDNSVNASRSTVSQEAVQEFQVVTNSFAPEFGRSSGGIVNVVTKSGTNDFHGNIFGFLRDKSFQARNPFSPIEKPVSDELNTASRSVAHWIGTARFSSSLSNSAGVTSRDSLPATWPRGWAVPFQYPSPGWAFKRLPTLRRRKPVTSIAC